MMQQWNMVERLTPEIQKSTPSKSSIAPEKWELEDYFPFGMGGLCQF